MVVCQMSKTKKKKKHKIDEGIFKSVYFSDLDLSTQVQPINYNI